MENNKKSKGLIITIIVLILIIIGLVGFIVYNQFFKSNSENADDNTVINDNNTLINNVNENNNTINNTASEITDGKKYFKQVQLNENFVDIEDVAVEKLKIDYRTVYNTTEKNIFYMHADIDKDGKEDTIKLEDTFDEFGKTGVYNIYFNDKNFIDMNDRCMSSYLSFYIVDLNKNDKYLDFVIYGDFASDDYGYQIYSFNGTNFEKKCDNFIDLAGEKMYTNEKDKIILESSDFVNSNPIVATEYYSYTNNKKVKIEVSTLKDVKVNVKNVYFTKSLDAIGKVMLDDSEDINFDEKIKKQGITFYKSLNVYITNYDNGSDRIKVKLEDGTEGYIFIGDGNFAG